MVKKLVISNILWSSLVVSHLLLRYKKEKKKDYKLLIITVNLRKL